MNIENSNKSAEYWNTVADNIRSEVSNDLWRQHADCLNTELLKRFLSSYPSFERTLKTDLFDESLGSGLVPFLSKISKEAAGIDISYFTTLYTSESHTQCLAVNASVIAPPFRGKSFDLIVSNSTLDHFSTEKEIGVALRSLARVLQPGGHLIWTMDNPANPIVGLRNALTRRRGTIGFLVPYKIGKTWNLQKMVRETSALGLDVVDTALIMHCPRILVVQFLKCLKILKKNASGKMISKGLRAMETMESLPSRAISAHYCAVHAIKKN
ncbi:MAG: class I SAM-dependent methyltransferase [Acidobacteriota bacterium]